jgi:hypothetical protein
MIVNSCEVSSCDIRDNVLLVYTTRVVGSYSLKRNKCFCRIIRRLAVTPGSKQSRKTEKGGGPSGPPPFNDIKLKDDFGLQFDYPGDASALRPEVTLHFFSVGILFQPQTNRCTQVLLARSIVWSARITRAKS